MFSRLVALVFIVAVASAANTTDTDPRDVPCAAGQRTTIPSVGGVNLFTCSNFTGAQNSDAKDLVPPNNVRCRRVVCSMLCVRHGCSASKLS